jgi:Rrf2 family protein
MHWTVARMMDISTKGRYATRIMVFLAEWPGRPLTKTEISEAEDVTPGYLQQIMTTLLSAGLVRSYRGKAGGFALARPPETITVGEVLRATEGKVTPAPCWNLHNCERARNCPTRPFWLKAAHLLDDLFDGTTIADLAADAKSPDRSSGYEWEAAVAGLSGPDLTDNDGQPYLNGFAGQSKCGTRAIP